MDDVRKATVKTSMGFTLNLGNYESARLEAGVEIQGKETEIKDLWLRAEKEVSEQLDQQIKLLREQLANKSSTLLGTDKSPKISSRI